MKKIWRFHQITRTDRYFDSGDWEHVHAGDVDVLPLVDGDEEPDDSCDSLYDSLVTAYLMSASRVTLCLISISHITPSSCRASGAP